MCFTSFQYPPGACSFSSENTVSVVMCRSLSWCRNVYEKYADMAMMKKTIDPYEHLDFNQWKGKR